MKKKIVAIMMMAVLALSTACGADGETTAVAHRQAIKGRHFYLNCRKQG